MTITAKRLEELGACKDQIATFRAIWGDGPAPMTIEAAVENAEKFSWGWAAAEFLSPEAWAKYNRATDEAWAEYRRAAMRGRDYKRPLARAFAEAYIKQEIGE